MLQPSTINAYIETYKITWAVEMPKDCPPNDIMVAHAHPFFRLTPSNNAISTDDFLSYAELNPGRDWGEQLPLAVGLSVIDNEAKARRNLKLPMFRRHKGIIALCLNPTDGVVKQTGVHLSHYTWWRTKNFDINQAKLLTT